MTQPASSKAEILDAVVMLAREKEKLNALRAIKSAILLAKTSKGAADTMSEEAEIKLLKQLVKQRQDSAAIYKEQNRDDLYQEEKAQLDVIAAYLPRAVKDGNDLEARERVAYGSTMAGITMQLTSTTAQHSMEHAMSAYHRDLPHGAGLIMVSREFAQFFVDKHACDERFLKMAKAMGVENPTSPQDFVDALVRLQEACGVADLKMSDYGIVKDECMTLAKNARDTMGGLYAANPCELTDEDVAGIFERSYR